MKKLVRWMFGISSISLIAEMIALIVGIIIIGPQYGDDKVPFWIIMWLRVTLGFLLVTGLTALVAYRKEIIDTLKDDFMK